MASYSFLRLARLLALLVLTQLWLCSGATAQDKVSTEDFNALSLDDKRTALVTELNANKHKFARTDLYHTILGSQNKSPYGGLFVINGLQLFRLDIVDAYCVEDFVHIYLDTTQLTSISRLPIDQAAAMYGTLGSDGVTIIEVADLGTLADVGCGFRIDANKIGDNFDQWREGDLIIHCKAGVK